VYTSRSVKLVESMAAAHASTPCITDVTHSEGKVDESSERVAEVAEAGCVGSDLPERHPGTPPLQMLGKEPNVATKVFVATPCFGCCMCTDHLMCMLELMRVCQTQGICLRTKHIGNESLVQRARNLLVAKFLKSDCTHLLFIDSDIVFEPSIVIKLLRSDKDIVTVTYPKKAIDWEAVAHKLRNPEETPLEPVHMLGLQYNANFFGTNVEAQGGLCKVLDSATGFMMIKRHVLERMYEAYRDELLCVNDLPGDRTDPQYIQEYVAIFDCMIEKSTRRYLSEDYAFVRRAQALGFDVWLDLTSGLCHLGNTTFEGDLRQRYRLVYEG
jgi:hypothetical protein